MSKKPESRSVATKTQPEGNGLKEQIDKSIGPIVPQGQRQEVISRIVSVLKSERFSGPLPHPSHMREYEEILPGSAERILSMAETEQNHNAGMEKTIVDAQIGDMKRGKWMGLGALLLLIGLAFYAGMNENNILAGILLGTGVLGVVSNLVASKFGK